MPVESPAFVPGIHNYCDHRCWRCTCCDRCAAYARWSGAPARQRPAFPGPAGRVASVMAVSLEVTIDEAIAQAQETSSPQPALTRPRVEAAERRPSAERDPLVVRGGEYARLTWPILRALQPILAEREDGAALEAAERLEETCTTLASKVFRAVSSSLDAVRDDSEARRDADGSAKVAMMLIDESRQAWRVLMQRGRAAADGVPARLIGLLDAIEAGLLTRFPNAPAFRRPGFDQDPDRGEVSNPI